jgi:integrase
MASFKQNDKTKLWYFVIDIGEDLVTNRRLQKRFSVDDRDNPFETEQQARRYAIKVEDDLARGRKFDSIKLGPYMTEYFEKVVIETVSEVSYDNYWRTASLHIIPFLGHMQLDKITDETIEKYYVRLAKEKRSRAIISMVQTVLSKFFRFAVKKRKIIDNPMKLVTTPSYKPKIKEVWTSEQVDQFLECNRDSRFYTLYVVAESTGMRRGELLSLKWSDIDLDNGKITVNKSIKYSTASKKHVKGTKTENSRRTVSIPQYTVEALREHIKGRMEGVDIVFDNFGEYYAATYLSDEFSRDAAKTDLPYNTLHGLRHSHATYLLSNGFSVADVAARLGDTKETIMKTYAHVLPNTQNEIVSALDRRKTVNK